MEKKRVVRKNVTRFDKCQTRRSRVEQDTYAEKKNPCRPASIYCSIDHPLEEASPWVLFGNFKNPLNKVVLFLWHLRRFMPAI